MHTNSHSPTGIPVCHYTSMLDFVNWYESVYLMAIWTFFCFIRYAIISSIRVKWYFRTSSPLLLRIPQTTHLGLSPFLHSFFTGKLVALVVSTGTNSIVALLFANTLNFISFTPHEPLVRQVKMKETILSSGLQCENFMRVASWYFTLISHPEIALTLEFMGQRLEVIWEQSQRRRKWIFMGGD